MLSFGLIGYPLEHSLSPRLHGAALKSMHLDGEYQLYPVPPPPGGASGLEELVEKLRRGQLRGLNVTIPHKQNVMAYLDDFSPAAAAIGAANTLYMQEGRLVGDNTDAPGFAADLTRIFDELAPTGFLKRDRFEPHALVLGAGGSARAVVYALLMEGWRVTIAARRLEQAGELVTGFQTFVNKGQQPFVKDQPSNLGLRITPVDLHPDSIHNLQSKITLVVNATPVGMWPQIDASPWPSGLPLPDGALVYDLVYNPAETALLKAAYSAGLVRANGLGMLVEQAALALELWTGRSVPRRPMWEIVPEFRLEGFSQVDSL
jgi:shikimate dehydrogenase